MNAFGKSLFLITAASLLLATQAFAIPVAGTSVRMERDWNVPYTMTDLSTNQSYQTFCLESQNYFYPGSTYYVQSVGDYVTGGGGGAIGGMDQLSAETKWLYAAFSSGAFAAIESAAQKVQHSIWYLEDEIGGIQSDWDLLNNIAFDDSGWKVVAVNLTSYNQYGEMVDNQSQLVGAPVPAPVPEPASLILLGTGLVGLAGMGRRKFKKIAGRK